MECPGCNSLIEKSNVEAIITEENDYIEIDIMCPECDKEFFARIWSEDLMPVE